MTIGQLVQMAYSLTDRIYIGHLPQASAAALTGLGLTFPVIFIVAAFTNLFGTGGAPLFSIARGRQDKEAQLRYLHNTYAMLLWCSFALAALFELTLPYVMRLFGAGDLTLPYAVSYLRLYLCGTPFIMLAVGLNGFINAQGFGKAGMYSVLLGAVLNIILDPIFIFVFGWGLQGAAVASVISQLCSAVYVLRFLTGHRTQIKLNMSYLRPERSCVREIVRLGFAGFVMQATNGAVQIAANNTLRMLGGEVYIGIMTILSSVRDVVMVPLHGFTGAAQAVLGYNYGAGKLRRVVGIIAFITPVSVTYMLLLWLIIFLLPREILGVFSTDPALIETGIKPVHIYFFGFFMMALHSTGQTVFVALGRYRPAVFFSLLRKAFVVIPLTIALPYCWDLQIMGVFWAEPVSNFISGLLCYGCMLWTMHILLREHWANKASGA